MVTIYKKTKKKVKSVFTTKPKSTKPKFTQNKLMVSTQKTLDLIGDFSKR